MSNVCACIDELVQELRRTNKLLKWLVAAILAQQINAGTDMLVDDLVEVKHRLEEVIDWE